MVIETNTLPLSDINNLVNHAVELVEQGEFMQQRGNRWWTFAQNDSHRIHISNDTDYIHISLLQHSARYVDFIVTASVSYIKKGDLIEVQGNGYFMKDAMNKLVLMCRLGVLDCYSHCR